MFSEQQFFKSLKGVIDTLGLQTLLAETVRRKPYGNINETLMAPYWKILNDPTIHKSCLAFSFSVFHNTVMTKIFRKNYNTYVISPNHILSLCKNKNALVCLTCITIKSG